jgi:hypothetical protein
MMFGTRSARGEVVREVGEVRGKDEPGEARARCMGETR